MKNRQQQESKNNESQPVVKNINDLAKILNVSATTISRVLNGKAEKFRISKKTQIIVMDAAAKHNYLANKIARGLKMDRTDTIGLILPDISYPFFAVISQGVESEARKFGFSLILCDSDDDESKEKELINLLLSYRVDGIIIGPVGKDYEFISHIYNSGIPIVLVDRCPTVTEIPNVSSDNYQGAYDAVNYMISRGHKRIACIEGSPDLPTNYDRVRGYKDALKNNNLQVDKNLIVGNYHSIENGYKNMHILMNIDPPPSAIISLSNRITLGILKAAKEKRITVGREFSLISFDEQLYSQFLEPPMTTISQKNREMGQLAVDLLLRNINNRNESGSKGLSMKLKTDLIIRESVRRMI
jgi:LacI family transcriptional regulator